MMKKTVILVLFISLSILVACTEPKISQKNTSNSQIANPASVNCKNNGGNLEIKTDNSGGQYGVCVFSDGSTCEEWAYFRGECNKGDSLKK